MGERTETRTFVSCDRCGREMEYHALNDHDWVKLHAQKRNGGTFFSLASGDGYNALICGACASALTRWFNEVRNG